MQRLLFVFGVELHTPSTARGAALESLIRPSAVCPKGQTGKTFGLAALRSKAAGTALPKPGAALEFFEFDRRQSATSWQTDKPFRLVALRSRSWVRKSGGGVR